MQRLLSQAWCGVVWSAQLHVTASAAIGPLRAYIHAEEIHMKPSTKDQIAGTVDEVKGAVKQKAGQAVGNDRLEAEGQAQNISGKIQKKVGQVEKVFEK